jgi:HPr kinase/phosphorylase
MAATLTLHATTVAVEGRGILITGPAGAGKSSLALALMALGARLVADDQTILTAEGAALVATCPPSLHGMIEARGIGILRADAVERAVVTVAVDMGQTETERLPEHRDVTYLGRMVPLVLGQRLPHFPSALLHYVRAGRMG